MQFENFIQVRNILDCGALSWTETIVLYSDLIFYNTVQ